MGIKLKLTGLPKKPKKPKPVKLLKKFIKGITK